MPRAQLVRPHQRRSLMRRTLMEIVPPEVLNRNKAFVSRGPMTSDSANWEAQIHATRNMLSDSLGLVDSKIFADSLQKARNGLEVPLVPVMRTLVMEFWLRHFHDIGFVWAPPRGHKRSVREQVQDQSSHLAAGGYANG
jgi:hypothetical protein